MSQHPTQFAPGDDELMAAALAAVQLYLEAEQSDAEEPAPSRSVWRFAALVAAQGVAPARGGGASGWGMIDRSTRAARWSAGILGTFD